MAEPDLNSWIKPEVLAQLPYRLQERDTRIKLNQNESPWDWPELLKERVVSRLRETAWNRYPPLVPQKLKEKLADSLAVLPEQIVVGKGSNEVLQAIVRVNLRPGDSLCTLSPTFAVYGLLGEQQQARIMVSPLTKNFQVDERDLLSKVCEARLTILCNPNSPTGSLMALEQIEHVAGQASGLVVVDEAYVDFSGITALPLLDRYPNLMVTRTFSKAFALAGFRLGFAVMHPDLAREVQKGLLPFNLDVPSAVAGEVLLDHAEEVAQRARFIVWERDRLIERLNTLPGVRAWPSRSNFFLLATPWRPGELCDRLAVQAILVRDVSGYPGCSDVVRVTVGKPEENAALMRAVEALL